MKKQLMRRVVVGAMVAICACGSAQAQAVVMGKDYVNIDGVKMDFRKKSNLGNAFWRSETAPLAGMDAEAQSRACLLLTQRARAAGRIPAGYGYFPNQGMDGKYVLVKMEELGVGNEPLAALTEKPGFYKSPFAPGKPALDLSDESKYPSGMRVRCPYSGQVFKKP